MSVFDFSHIPIQECGEPMVELDPCEFVVEPMYFAWEFTNTPCMWLRIGVIEKLRKAKQTLPTGWNFKLWDGFRPLKVQQALWEDAKQQVRTKNPSLSEEGVVQEARKFIAIPDTNPQYPPPHNTGGTIDLTLVDEQGKEVPMGTKFDEFSEWCEPYFFHEHPEVQRAEKFVQNRDILMSAMSSEGFRLDSHEWWHYDYGNQLWALDKQHPYAIYGSAEGLIPQQ